MIPKLRRRLTCLYSGIFGLFLVAFIVLLLSVLVWGTYVERRDEVKILAGEIARQQRETIIQYYKGLNNAPQMTSVEDDYDISGQVFYYLYDNKGQIVKADLPVPLLRDVLLAEIGNWKQTEGTKITLLNLPNHDYALVAIAKHQILQGESKIPMATIYVGRDITAYSRIFFRAIFTLAVLALIFLLLAALIGYLLASKVTVPIEEAIVRQKQFVADASHELRNPLSVLLSSIEAIEMDGESTLSPFARQIIYDAKDEFSRLKQLVNDLLTLARADAGDLKLKKETFDLYAIAEQVIRSLNTVAEQRKILIHLEALKPVVICADPEKIHQLLYILIDNGIKYSPGGGQVVVRLEPVQGGLSGFIKIAVQDNGPGIEPEFQKQIFKRFFRVDEARSRDIEGSGLGLSIAKCIVDAHKGKIHVESTWGKGSCFIIFVPKE